MIGALRLPGFPQLSDLLDGMGADVPVPPLGVEGVALDSRKLAPGYVFFALEGQQQHGLDYFDAAVAVGVSAVLVDAEDARYTPLLKANAASRGVLLLAVPALAQQVGVISARLLSHPSRGMTLVGVTGTDGKTSVSQYIAQALHDYNIHCGVVGTLGNGVPGKLVGSGLTTPDAVSLQHTLADFRQSNITHVAMEVSSHAVSQGRVNGVEFDFAVLTNLGRDHIDYHQTLENYHAAKWQLLQSRTLQKIVVNIDDPTIRRYLAGCDQPEVIRYASDPAQRAAADVFAEDVVLTGQGIDMTIVTAGHRLALHSRLIAGFNVGNLLATFATLHALGLTPEDSAECLAKLQAVPGRAERFCAANGVTAIVDYAHTPQALQAILRSVRIHCMGVLWCVFGCGGDRDRGKRAAMGEVAENFADRVVITDDNPRTENGDDIVTDILSGLKKPAAAAIERNREQAIRTTLQQANATGKDAQDWVVIAGKGHEDYQIIGQHRIHLCDREIVASAIQEMPSD